MNREFTLRRAGLRVGIISIGLILLVAGEKLFASRTEKEPKPVNVGMIALLASPEKYNNKSIRTIGFLHLGRIREDDSLWLYEEDGKLFLYQNSFALALSDAQRRDSLNLNHTYVLITGTFRSEKPGSTKMDSGTIVNITEIGGWQPYQPPSPTAK